MLDISSLTNKQIYLKSSPKDKLLEDNFEFKSSKVENLDNNQVLVEVIYQTLCRDTEDHQNAAKSFVAKEKPVFTGR